MSPFELDRHVHKDLRALPPPKAPAHLAARVMAAKAARENRPWHARPWMTWPREWQLASGAALAALVVALGASAPVVFAWLGNAVAYGLAQYAPGLRTGLVTARTVWEALVHPTAVWLAPVFLLMWAATAACGVALTRIASGEVSR